MSENKTPAPVQHMVPVGEQFRTRIKGTERWTVWCDGAPNPVRSAEEYVEVETRTIYTPAPVSREVGK